MARLRRLPRRFGPLVIVPAAVALLAIGASLPSSDRPSDPDAEGTGPTGSMTALAPFETLLDDLQEGAGVAVDSEGTIFVADRKAAVIYQYKYQYDPAIPSVTMPFAGLAQLQAPVGLWVEEDGNLLVADEGSGQVWRLNGGAELVAKGLKKPRWLARDGDAAGSLYITAEGLLEQRGLAGVARREGSVLLRLPRGGARAEVLLSGLRSPQGVASPAGSTLPVAVEGFQRSGEAQGPAVLGVRLDLPPEEEEGESPEVLVGAGVLQPSGLARDVLGALWLTAGQWRDPARPSDPPVLGVVARVMSDGALSLLVRGADSPQGLAFGPDGHLYLSERSRLLRFHAPTPPHLSPDPPAYTNQSTLQLAGTALPGASITARTSSETAIAQADPQTGIFSFSDALQLQANRENTIEAFATGLAGYGLTSAPRAFQIIHDDVQPSVSARTDPAGPYLRGQVHLIAEAQDPAPDGGTASGLARVTLRLLDPRSSQIPGTRVEGSGTPDSLLASLPLDSSSLPDGAYTLEATAEDNAGNRATVSLPRTLDNTPPTLAIPGISSGATVRGTLQVEVVSTDATSGLDRVELSLDGGPSVTSSEAPLRGVFDTHLLASGPHTLHARATDRAGNETTTTVHFTVANLTIHLASPATGSTVPEGPVLVQGTVESQAPEVGVVVNDVVANVHGGAFAALVPLEAGTGTMTILATDSFGATASTTATLTVASGSPEPNLLITPESGLAPLSVEFSAVSASPGTGATFTLDFGDGSPPHVAASLEGVSHTYGAPGLYLPTLTVTDPTGQRATVKGIIQAHAATTLDALLRSKWDSFRAALSRGDVGAALANVATSAQEKYRRVFQDLGPSLPTVAGQLQDIHLLEVLPGYAGYATYRQRQGEAFLYFIEFVQDADGLWRLENM